MSKGMGRFCSSPPLEPLIKPAYEMKIFLPGGLTYIALVRE